MLQLFAFDLQSIVSVTFTFVVIFLLESVLSVDNAAVLAVVLNKNHITPQNRIKALTYGMWGAYLFRGLSILGVGWLLANPNIGSYLKIAGAIYLLRLVYTHFTPQADSTEEGEIGWVKNLISKLNLSAFWITVIEVEILDFVFSIDNILAVVAMSKVFWIIIVAVFAAIATMRLVTKQMASLMEEYPYLENRAYIVIGTVALKLILSAAAQIFKIQPMVDVFESHWTDFCFSAFAMLAFLPIFVKKVEYQNPNTNPEILD